MKLLRSAMLIGSLVSIALPALADQFKLPEEIGRVESPRDTNLFQLEPTIIDERYYTSGRDERHQFVGTVLPEGAQIPDTDVPVPSKAHTVKSSEQSTKSVAPANAVAPTNSVEQPASKLQK